MTLIPRLWVLLVGVVGAGCSRSTSETVVVSNEGSGTVSLIDAKTDAVIATIPVGKRPRGLRASPDGKTVYVALSGSPRGGKGPRDDAADGIGVVDVARRALVRIIHAGRDPESFDVTADGRQLYVSNEETAEVSVVDVESGKVVRTIRVGEEPEGVTVSPDGRSVYVTSEREDAIDVIRTSDGVITARIPTAARPRAVVFRPDGREAYVTAEVGGLLQAIDTRTSAASGFVRTGGTGARPMGISLAPDGVHAFVANGREGSVAEIDLPARSIARSFAGVGPRPWGLALTKEGKKLYVAAGSDVAVVDVRTGTVTKRVSTGEGTWGAILVAAR